MKPPADSAIWLDRAAFGYDDTAVVTLTLDITRGQVVALVGPNGSGKSTTVRGLLGLTKLVSGSAWVLGEDLAHLRDRWRIGYVPQRHTLSTSVRATVEEVVAVGRLPHLGLLARLGRGDREVIGDSLELVGLADRAKDDVSTLSGGQQRRVLIARALAAQPELLIMDEPTAGVDERSQHVLAEVLDRLAQREVTMLIVTHELAPLAGVVRRVVELSSGRVHFDGSLAQYADHRHDELDQGCHPEDEPGRALHLPSGGPLHTGESHV